MVAIDPIGLKSGRYVGVITVRSTSPAAIITASVDLMVTAPACAITIIVVTPRWPKYDSTRRATMCFDVASGVVKDPHAAERAAWAGTLVPCHRYPADISGASPGRNRPT